ncbi:NADH-quinone oxidoreductase subunit J [Parvularcula sp. IMCC14364]|uniref:NADH-quinone oxidoreductase subunit J n=1 Tax=Parvularcula sp. IMCC14364 TaxID=3067902 RepID=UPI002740AAA1|nr:NADH-quinone oxidoreductase subunit J [Parvularcula sp. IMCC14364]
MFAQLAFYVFAGTTLAAGLGVILARNPVHSVLFLITAFIATAGLFVMMGAEYLAMLLVVVYVGAVAVLFLFVVMMLDVDFAELNAGYAKYIPFGIAIGVVLAVQIGFIVAAWQFPDNAELAREHPSPRAGQVIADPDGPTNVESLGMILYTDYVHFFQIAGMILLVSMIGAIILTFREREGVRRQDVTRQVGRKRVEGVEIVSVPTGKGIEG